MISIIIPTYKNIDYIDECIQSIINQENIDKIKYEILIGIDGDDESLRYIENNDFILNNCKVYYFNENKGPYLIRNTLAKLSSFDNLLFFDSDDILNKDFLFRNLQLLNKYNYIRYAYVDFKDDVFYKPTKTAHGQFIIKKDLFMKYNGFWDWMCGADSEFLYRVKENYYEDDSIGFYRRIHPNSLTQNEKFGMKSDTRKNYHHKIQKYKRDNTQPLELITTDNYKLVK